MKKVSTIQENKSYLSLIKAAWCLVIWIGYSGFNLVVDYDNGAMREPAEHLPVVNVVTKMTKDFKEAPR